jgi:predicted aspartyl protease
MAKINFDPQSPVIAVDMTLEGEGGIKRRIKVALDTGATYTMIPWEIAEALGYKPEISKEKVTLITASGVETAPLIEIKKIKFLGEGLDNVPVVINRKVVLEPRCSHFGEHSWPPQFLNLIPNLLKAGEFGKIRFKSEGE